MIDIFAITGTNGKTTTSYMLRSMLLGAGRKTGLLGTVMHIVGENVYEPVNTTPGKNLIKEYLHQMKENSISCCVMEASSAGLHQGRLDDVCIKHGIFTNLTEDHLDYHKNMEDYYRAKKLLFEKPPEKGIINTDDSWGKRLAAEMAEKTEIVTCGINDVNACYKGEIIREDITGQELLISKNKRKLGILKVSMPGAGFAYDALLAAASAAEAGIPFCCIASGLQKLTAVPGRWQIVWDKDDVICIVDYAHTPDALENLLKTAGRTFRGNIVCIFGCGGDRDHEKRYIMGEIAGRLSDYVIITSDNPRNEDPEDISAQIEEGLYSTGCAYSVIPDRNRAIKRGVGLARKGTVIIIAGKGHEKYQITGKKKIPFDDVLCAQKHLKEKYL